jgi:putative ABC transport system permease protein
MDFSRATLRDRWQLFAGAAITVALAVALVQSSLLALVSAATADVPAGLPEIERLAVSSGYAGAVSLLGITVAIAFFVSIFIVSSTFAFAVAQRRRDMALLRLVGASRRQVRHLLLAESVTIGAIGTIVGVPTGMLVADLQDRMLIGLDLVPHGFRTEWRPWIIAVSAGVGVIIAALAAWGAAFRAGRVQPLEALRGSLRTDRVMTVWRWSIGSVALAGAIALMIIAPLVGIDAGLALSINVCLVLVVALAALAPLIVPPVAGLLAVLARVLVPRSPLRDLVSGNVRTSVRRTTSTAAPIVVLVGLVGGLGGALAAIEDGMAVEATAVHTSDVIAVSHDEVDELIATTPGVEMYSTSTEAVVHVMASDDPGTEELQDTSVFGRTVDPISYLTVNDLAASHGDLDSLANGAVAVTKELAGRMDVDVGDTTDVVIGGREHSVVVGAILSTRLDVADEILVPAQLAEGASPDAFGTHEIAIVIENEAAAEAVIETLDAVGIHAQTTPDAIETLLDDANRQNRSVQIALLGLSALFAMVAIVNAVVAAGTDRHEEFATHRLSGLTRGQVVRTALAESGVVVATGVLLGSVAAGGTAVTMSAVVTKIVGDRIFAVPWTIWGGVVAAVGLVVVITTFLTTTAVTRHDPIAVAGARE